ncbi:hypothetical protein K469DRAFT_552631, partial [Zopfia rhizophila CBS 207.26]
IEFPANSLDLNPIENLWNKLKDAVSRRRPRSKEELREVIVEEWAKIDLSEIQ